MGDKLVVHTGIACGAVEVTEHESSVRFGALVPQNQEFYLFFVTNFVLRYCINLLPVVLVGN